MGSSGAFSFLSLLLTSCLLALSCAQDEFLHKISCSNNVGNFTPNSVYNENLSFLFASLSQSKNDHGFYNISSGHSDDQINAIALCRRDIQSLYCIQCINVAVTDLRSNCPNKKEAILWYDYCMVRYSNRSISGLLETSPNFPIPAPETFTTDATIFNAALTTLLNGLRTSAASGALKFATGMTSVSSGYTIYALVQCTPDLSQLQCNSCLSQALERTQDCCQGKAGGRVLAPSCNVKFNTRPFYFRIPEELLRPSEPLSPPWSNHSSSPSATGGSKRKWITIAASSSAVFVFLVFISFFAFIIWRRRNIGEDKESSQEVQLLDLGRGKVGNDLSKEGFQSENVGGSQEFPSMQLDIINAATEHFSEENKLGQGGFGPVYKGTLEDGKEIAVKRLSRTSGQGLIEFKNEVMLIAKLQHRNLVRLLGCCLEDNETLLVYEYMPNRSLDVFLFDAKMSVQLDWLRRFSIINGIVRGIVYLHEDSRLRIVHRDLKASNILLDGEMNPKISDFGMARIFGGNQSEANTNRVVGTYGYMAPEYAMEGLFSIKSDVFSFGVLLLEIISGKKNNGFYFYERCESLLTFAWKLWSGGEGMQLVDPILVRSRVESEVIKCIHIGLLCVQKDPADRPTMSSVIVMLANETIILPEPTEPAFFVGRVVEQPAQPPTDNIVCSINEVTLSNVSPR